MAPPGTMMNGVQQPFHANFAWPNQNHQLSTQFSGGMQAFTNPGTYGAQIMSHMNAQNMSNYHGWTAQSNFLTHDFGRPSPQQFHFYRSVFLSHANAAGFLLGQPAYSILSQSGLPQEDLAKIWDLADVGKDGMLDFQEFMVAMHLIFRRLHGFVLPAALTGLQMTSAAQLDTAQHAGVPANAAHTPPAYQPNTSANANSNSPADPFALLTAAPSPRPPTSGMHPGASLAQTASSAAVLNLHSGPSASAAQVAASDEFGGFESAPAAAEDPFAAFAASSTLPPAPADPPASSSPALAASAAPSQPPPAALPPTPPQNRFGPVTSWPASPLHAGPPPTLARSSVAL